MHGKRNTVKFLTNLVISGSTWVMFTPKRVTKLGFFLNKNETDEQVENHSKLFLPHTTL